MYLVLDDDVGTGAEASASSESIGEGSDEHINL